MEVLDIVQSAAFKCGLISSFNPDEIAGEYVQAGRKVLTDEILPSLNCDRTIDITVTARTYVPKNGRIVLMPFRQPNENLELIGYSELTYKQISDPMTRPALDEVYRLRPTWRDNWPVDDFDEPRIAAMWTSDLRLAYVLRTNQGMPVVTVNENANIDFPPMRVDNVLEESSRIEYEYVYRDEFEKAMRCSSIPGLYTVEEYEDKLVVLINGSNAPKRLILPVPLQIIDRDHAHAGTIIAPEKFKRYLIDSVAVSMAIIYGLSTIEEMKAERSTSYNLLKKNKTQRMHEANVSQEIANRLRSGRDIRNVWGV